VITIDEARERTCARYVRMPSETVVLEDALDRVLAADVIAPIALPPWPASAMDGFALHAEDAPGTLRVVDDIAAGRAPSRALGGGEAARIMTGAMLPPGADTVVKIEDVSVDGDLVEVPGVRGVGQHVRAAGSDVSQGARVLEAGTVLGPGAIGLLAGLGIPTVRVARRPRVAILSTGDEVVAPGARLGPAQIPSANNALLAAWVRRGGGVPCDLGIVRDDPVAVRAALEEACTHDLVLTTGGVSVGDHDHVRDAFHAAGIALQFWRVDMKPGKPLAYGLVGEVPVFGLPGNPVSCMVNFLVFARPVLRRMLGDLRPDLPRLRVRMTAPWDRAVGRPEWLRVTLAPHEDGVPRAHVAATQGSASLQSMSRCDALLLVPADVARVEGDYEALVVEPGWSARCDPPR
jgi:molybdopterin molybdotransferase